MRLRSLRIVLLLAVLAVPAAAQEKFTNLKVLPQDIPPQQLHQTMDGFTRALGVRCIHCHVGQEGKPFKHEDFALDDKPAKLKAREMMRMVSDINNKYLANLPDRSSSPVKVECITCHRGVTQPRQLHDVLDATYDGGGIDSTVARYQALRAKYYGRAAYDFGEVPLTLVADHARTAGHAADAERLLAMNVDANPTSDFARRQYAGAAIARSFREQGRDSGAATVRALRDRYGDKVVSENLLNDVGYQLLGAGQVASAVDVLRLNTVEHPQSGNAFDSCGESLMTHGDKKGAIAAYTRSLELDPSNDNARQMLAQLKAPAKPGKKGSASH